MILQFIKSGVILRLTHLQELPEEEPIGKKLGKDDKATMMESWIAYRYLT